MPTRVEDAAPPSSHVAAAELTAPAPLDEWRRSLEGITRAALGGFADGCLVHALDPDQVWRCECAFAGEAGAERLARPAGLPASLGELVAAARPRLVEDADGAHDPLLREFNARSLVTVPARAEGRVVAALTFFRRAPRPGFQRGDLPLAEALAATAAIALRNAALYARERRAPALQEAEARLRLAVEAADIGTWDYDPRSGVLVWSDREKALFGLSRAAGVDHDTFLRGVHPDDRERAVEKVERAQDPASGGKYSDEFRTVGLDDGIERWISAQGRCFFDEHGVPTRFIGTDVDVTERRLASQRMALLAEASRALVPGRERGSVERALGVVAHRVAERLGDACWVALLDADGASLLSTAVEARHTTLSTQLAALRGARVPVQDDWLGRVVRDRRPRLVPILDARSEPELQQVEVFRPMLAGAGLTSLVLAPLVVAGRALGVIVCVRAGGRAYGHSDLLVLQDLADRCALAIAETRSFHRAERVHQQIESIIDAVPFPISYIDASGRYAYVSRGYELWFERPRTQFVGEHMRETVGAEAYEKLRPMVEGALRGERQQFEITLPYARGGTREVDATYLPQFDESGRPSGFVAVILDVSEHKALVESLRRALRFSDEFVGMLGHDLRTPLTAISLTSAYLLRQLADHWAAKPVLRIQGSARRMARMIEQVLDFTRARLGGGIPVRPVPMDLAAVADEIIVEVRSRAPQPVTLELAGDTHGQWDPDRLGQVLSNLLSNAVEHGHKEMPVRVELRGTEPDSVLLTVWNAGVIPESVLPVVFDRFQRGDADPPPRSGGLGLGLYIVRQIVLAHGGTIEVRSSEAEGTRFSVLLPRVSSARPAIGEH